MIKKFMSYALVLVLCFSIINPAFAENSLGITYNAVLSATELNTSESNQEVVVTIKTSDKVTIDSLVATFSWESPLQLVSITGGAEMEQLKAVEAGTPVDNKVNLAWYEDYLTDAENITDLLIATFTVPANTEPGIYEFSVSEMQLANEDAGNTWETGATATATLTIKDASANDGYVANISSNVGDDGFVRVDETIEVNFGTNKAYAATEMIITYDSQKVSFDEESSTLGNASVDAATAGVLKLADYGADKNSSDANYTLAFSPITAGDVQFKITEAGFGTGTSAEDKNLTDATVSTDGITVTIKELPYTVTLPEDGIFAGEDMVEAGESYTFGKETKSGTSAYYD